MTYRIGRCTVTEIRTRRWWRVVTTYTVTLPNGCTYPCASFEDARTYAEGIR